MLSQDRLRSSRDILATLRSRRQQAGRFVVTHVAPTSATSVADVDVSVDAGPARVAVIASKKVGSAVARNRAKRVLREASRRVEWTTGTNVVLVARARAVQAHPDQVTEEMLAHASALQGTRPVGTNR